MSALYADIYEASGGDIEKTHTALEKAYPRLFPVYRDYFIPHARKVTKYAERYIQNTAFIDRFVGYLSYTPPIEEKSPAAEQTPPRHLKFGLDDVAPSETAEATPATSEKAALRATALNGMGVKTAAGAMAILPTVLEVTADATGASGKPSGTPEAKAINVTKDVLRGSANIIVSGACATEAMAAAGPWAAGISVFATPVAGAAVEGVAGLVGGSICYFASNTLIEQANNTISGHDYGEFSANVPPQSNSLPDAKKQPLKR